MATISITSHDGKLDSASSALEVSATNPDYNQPVLRIKQAGTRGGAASIRIDDQNPDVEFVEIPQDPNLPAKGKYKIAIQLDKLQINGRNASNTAFEPIVVLQRLGAGGNIGFRATQNKDFGGGHGVIAIATATVVPAMDPAGGGILDVANGPPMYRGSNGTVTMIAPA